MTLVQFLASLRQANVALTLDGDGGLLVESHEGVLNETILGQIRLRKQELMVYLRSLEQAPPVPARITPQSGQESYPLSSAQKRLWMIDRIENGSIAYNIPNVVELNGVFDPRLYEDAINAVVRRHEILRTVFREDGSGAVRQWILDPDKVRFVLLYFDNRNSCGRSKAENCINEDKKNPFDLREWPLFNVILFRLEDEKYLLYYNVSHIISDGSSMAILHRDVLRCYEALQTDRSFRLPELTIHYKDFSVWQQQRLHDEAMRGHREYWLDQFKGELPVLDLSSSRPRPPFQTHNGHCLSMILEKEHVERLRLFCRQRNGSLFMGLLSLVKLLFYRYTGQKDIIIGTPISGRDQAELEEQIGFYINTLAIRSQLDGEDSFEELFDKVRGKTLSAYEHQQYPFDVLVEDLKVRRDAARPILFDVILILQNQQHRQVSQDAVREAGITDGGPTAVKFDIDLDFWEEGDGIYWRVEFNKDIYDKEWIARFMGHFRELLARAMDDPGRKIKDLDYLLPDEKWQLLTEFNATLQSYPAGKSILDLFAEQVVAGPDHLALVFHQESLSYGLLDIRTNQLAHYLRRRGVQRGQLVLVCMERSMEMIIAILGILKAGAAYVPVDPAYPPDRIAYMLLDTQATMIMTSRLPEKFQELFRHGDHIDMKVHLPFISQEPETKLSFPPQPDDLAYVIYTSGSTGRPKGVMIEHTAVVNLIHWHIKRYGVDRSSRSTFMAGIGFDATVLEIWSALLSGSTLYILTDDIKLDSQRLVHLYETAGITHAFVPPALIPGVVKASRGKPMALQYILIGGDRLQPEEVEGLSYTLVNQYGPTESTVMVTDYPIYKDDPGAYPIGSPIANCRIYILDNHQKLVPVGVAGELYIGGVQLSRGYLNNPALTAEKFVTIAFGEEVRLYRTGDLARWREDGQLEYLGRADGQVKIRGHRVEPGEIEQALLKMEGITSAIVQPGVDRNGNAYLAAYVISPAKQTIGALRHRLAKSLPGPMIPEYFVQVADWPLTANGKIDRSALPDPLNTVMDTGSAYTPPCNSMEAQLAAIFAAVLQKDVRSISVTDNFFDMGATSLTLIEITARINKELNNELKVLSLFQYPTIKSLTAQYSDNADHAMRHSMEEVDSSAGLDEAMELFSSSN